MGHTTGKKRYKENSYQPVWRDRTSLVNITVTQRRERHAFLPQCAQLLARKDTKRTRISNTDHDIHTELYDITTHTSCMPELLAHSICSKLTSSFVAIVQHNCCHKKTGNMQENSILRKVRLLHILLSLIRVCLSFTSIDLELILCNLKLSYCF